MEYNQPGQSPYGAPMLPPEQPKPPKMRRGGKAENDGPPVTKKVVSRQLRLAVIMALIAFIIFGLVAYGSQAPKLYVARAVDNIAAGAEIDVDTQIEAVPITEDLVEDGAYTGTTAEAALKVAREDLDGQRAQYPITARAQLNKDDFALDLPLSSPLKADERLMSISASVANALAGQIRPGDHVDIAASDGEVSGVVLSDVEIVAVTVSESQYQAVADQQRGEEKNTKPEELLPGAPVPGIYTVRVSSADAARLYAVDAGADLALIFRPKGAPAGTSAPMTAKTVICENNPTAEGC